MIPKTLSYLVLPLIAVVVLTVWPAEAFAQRGGGHGGGGFHGGYGGVHYGGVGGYHSYYGGYGYRPYYGYRSRPFYGYGFYPYYGSGYYPNYYQDYYYQNYWAYPSTNYDSGVDPNLGLAPASDPSTTVPAAPPAPTAPIAPTNGTGSSSPNGERELFSSSSADNSTRITVRLPAGADLWFEGTKMTATGPVRVFSVPPVTPGRQYTYTVRARWVENDITTDQTRTVVFTAGTDLDVSFPAPSGNGEKAKGTITP
jgi:uncharacterized protein (TIGR03000 family)